MKKLVYTLLACLVSITVFAEGLNKVMFKGKEVQLINGNNELVYPENTSAKVISFEMVIKIGDKSKTAKTVEQVKAVLTHEDMKTATAVLKIKQATDANGKEITLNDISLSIE